ILPHRIVPNIPSPHLDILLLCEYPVGLPEGGIMVDLSLTQRRSGLICGPRHI
ncbi:hypothetical protein NDU88_007184, partial [Pleurodeles waltl]